MKHFLLNKTYEIWDEESISIGATDERGFEYENLRFETLEDLAEEIIQSGPVHPSSSAWCPSVWYSTVDADECYRTGEKTYYAFHPDGLSEEDSKRLFIMLFKKTKT